MNGTLQYIVLYVCVSGVQHKGFDCTISRWVWLKCPLSGVFYCTIWDGLLSVIRSSGVSAIQGVLMYSSLWRNDRDFQNCPLYRGCPLLRGVR